MTRTHNRTGTALAAVTLAALWCAMPFPVAHAQDSLCGSFCDAEVTPDDANDRPPVIPPQGPAYFLVVNGAQAGPFTLEQLRAMVGDGRLNAATLVWTKGMAAWTAAGEVAAVSALLTDAPPVIVDPRPATGDVVARLAGSWRGGPSEIELPNGVKAMSTLAFTFCANGSMSMDTEARMSLDGQPFVLTNRGTGNFTASEADGMVTITPDLQVTSTASGMQDERWRMTDPMRMRFTDADTLADEFGQSVRRVGS